MLNIPASIARHRATASVTRGREPEPWTLATLVDIVRRRIGVVAATAGLLLVLAMLYLAVAPARFTATAALVPDTKRTPPTPAEVPQDTMTDPALVESQIETIKSEKIALAVIGKLKLTDDSEFVPDPDLVTRILSALGVVNLSPRTDAVKQRIAVANFTRMLKVMRIGRSYVTEIAFTSLDRAKAATVANEIAAAYINDQLGARFFNAERANSWMEQRIAEVRQQMEEANRAVELLKAVNNLSLDSSGKSPNEREMERLSAALASARTETAQARQRFERAQLVLRGNGEERSGLPDEGRLDALGSETVDRLRREYREVTRQAPDRVADNGQPPANGAQPGRLAELRDAIWDEVEKVAVGYKGELDGTVQRETTMTRRIEMLEPHVQAERPQLARLREREATAQNYRTLHENLRNRHARITQFAQQQSLPVSEARVVTEATPPLSKSSPKSKLILFLALCAGGTLGLAAAIGREYFDRTVRAPEQIEQSLGIRTLGLLPLVTDAAGGDRSERIPPLARLRRPALSGHDKALPPLRSKRWLADIASDAIRAIRVAVDGGSRTPIRQAIGITSPQPGEGKTTVALSTAMLMARVGKRTLLIDGDLRDPVLTRTLTPQAKGGLAAALTDEAALAEHVVRHDAGFDLLPSVAGSADAHPSDVLSSPAMQSLIERARKTYDCVIVDLPPVLAHVDVMAAAALVDAYVMVVEFGRTPIDDIERSLATSNVMAERLVGVVINKSRPSVALGA